MKRAAVVGALAMAALAGCRTAPPARVEPPVAVTRAAEARTAWQQHVDGLLEAAYDAASGSSAEDYNACELEILEALQQARTQPGFNEDDAAYVAQVQDELERLGDQVGEDDTEADASQAADQEVPPEPLPVPEEKVAEAKEKAKKDAFDLPVTVNNEVASLIDYYTGPYHDKLILALERGAQYIPFIRQEFAKAGLPQDLAYLPLVESAFNTRARSRARAQGMWQFMKGTARLYNLRCDGLVDERNDPYLATEAAVSHLADLYSDFNDWELALAAYNSGSGNVRRALRRAHGQTSFWKIRRYLPRETRNYVPAFWAALLVAKHPENYGLPKPDVDPPCVARVPVTGALDLDVLADHLELSADDLATLNPALIHRLTPARGTYRLAVPCGDEQVVTAALESIPPDERIRRYLHTVQRGDTLGALARRYGSNVDAIMVANGIRNPRALSVGRTLVIPRGPGRYAYAQESSSRAEGGRHVVRRGETLGALARRYGTSVGAIMAANGLHDPRQLRAGRSIVIPSRSRRRVIASRAVEAPDRYVVRRGDTLYGIARRFGLSVPGIQRINALADTTIHPGDVLRLSQ